MSGTTMDDPVVIQEMRRLLCALGDAIRDGVVAARGALSIAEMTEISEVTSADTIYRIDTVSETVIAAWFDATWPRHLPVEIVMEGLEGHGTVTVPRGTTVENTQWKCIVDPIDGTRGLMYDKRSAWALAAVAPQRGTSTQLNEIVVAAMTELPTTKQWRADQVSGVRGSGRSRLVAESVNVSSGERRPLTVRPSGADDLSHGWASLAKFFPEGKALTAQIEEELWQSLCQHRSGVSGSIFDDQYLSTGGQIYELLSGHDRLIGDLRPLIFRKLGLDAALACHPYDICTAMLLQEAGGVVESPDGAPLTSPLDTTTRVAWMGYANERLAARVRPVLGAILARHGLG